PWQPCHPPRRVPARVHRPLLRDPPPTSDGCRCAASRRRLVLPDRRRRDGRPMTGLWLNVGCGTHRAPAPWVNIDVVDQGDTRPDVVVPAGTPLPYEAGTVERVYLGHVLEHVPWPNVAGFLAEIRRVLD